MEETSGHNNKIRGLIPILTVFLSNFCVMVMELTASRLIARRVGNSLYTWTSVIGIVLGGIAFGNFFGGRLADRTKDPDRSLGIILILSAFFCVLSLVIQNLLIRTTPFYMIPLPLYTFLHVLLMFFLPSVLMGAVSPIVAKTALERDTRTGLTVGRLYAWGAVGSIAGTFATGYWLTAWLGSSTIIWIVGAILLAMGLFYIKGRFTRSATLSLYLILFFLGSAPLEAVGLAGERLLLRPKTDPTLIYRTESLYNHIQVFQPSPESPILHLHLNDLVHNQIHASNSTSFLYDYLSIMVGLSRDRLTADASPSALVLGGGGYVLPRFLTAEYPGVRMETAEIDPAVTRTAERFFGLSGNPGFAIHHTDARTFIQQKALQKEHFDLVITDCLDSFQVPWQLTTKEFFSEVLETLNEDGLFMINVIDIRETGLLLASMARTMRSVFPHVYLIAPAKTEEGTRNTYILTGSLQAIDPQDVFRLSPGHKPVFFTPAGLDALTEKKGARILTDNLAPAMNLFSASARVIHRNIQEFNLLQDTLRHARQGEEDRAERILRRIIRRNPDSIEGHLQLGALCMKKNDIRQATALFERVLKLNPQQAEPHQNLGLIHYRNGDIVRAIRSFRAATAIRTNYAEAYHSLGVAYYVLNDRENAVRNFRLALKYDPSHPHAGNNLARLNER